MKPQAALAAIAALTLTVAAGLAPAFAARSSYVIDDAHLLSQTAIAQINQQVGDFNAQTGKEVVVVTVESLNGGDANAAVEQSFAQQQVNGVEIFIAKNEKQIKIAGDKASHQFFPTGAFGAIYQAMRPSFAQGNFDQGVETGVSLVLNTYRGHVSSLNRSRQPAGAVAPVRVRTSSSGGFNLGFIWWIIILAVIFFIIRGIFRAMSGPRNYGGGPGYGPGGPGGPGYGGPGYGGGYGGGGGSFWSGMLGGLGGAFLGNELFGNRGGNIGGGEAGGSYASTGDPGTTADAGGWQSDAGQIDTSNAGGGGWGDSGGGDSGGGWGGGDSGGGGGDSGGGW
jgi:uncharacterized protein